MPTAGAPRKYPVAELVLAYEMRTDGVPWFRLKREFGKGIRDAIEWAKRRGIHRGNKL